jgi:ATP-dependent Clp protease adaptor protein ClpS
MRFSLAVGPALPFTSWGRLRYRVLAGTSAMREPSPATENERAADFGEARNRQACDSDMSDHDKRPDLHRSGPEQGNPGEGDGVDAPPPGGGNGGEGTNTGVVVKARPKTRKPAMYKVLMLNDDYTPMEFVVHVLERFFQKNREEATRIMLHVHRRGVGVCGVFTYEVAETKVTQVMDLARQNQHPLQCTIEKE